MLMYFCSDEEDNYSSHTIYDTNTGIEYKLKVQRVEKGNNFVKINVILDIDKGRILTTSTFDLEDDVEFAVDKDEAMVHISLSIGEWFCYVFNHKEIEDGHEDIFDWNLSLEDAFYDKIIPENVKRGYLKENEDDEDA